MRAYIKVLRVNLVMFREVEVLLSHKYTLCNC